MARETIVRVISDLSGEELGEGAGRTVRFALEGATYEIDLTNAECDELYAALAPYVAAGRSVGRGIGAPRPRAASSARRGAEELAAIRDWLRGEGHEVADRGRIRADLVALYDAAH